VEALAATPAATLAATPAAATLAAVATKMAKTKISKEFALRGNSLKI